MRFVEARENKNNTYSLQFTTYFYDIFRPYITDGGSYYNILYRLFGMQPVDFYHWLGATYNVIFKRSTLINTIILIEFPTYNDILSFMKEVEKRLEYCEQAKFFF